MNYPLYLKYKMNVRKMQLVTGTAVKTAYCAVLVMNTSSVSY